MPSGPKKCSIFFFPTGHPGDQGVWKPNVDIYRSQNRWLIKFDLAGIKLTDVVVDIRGPHLTVSGIRRDCLVEEDWSHYSMEIAYNRFERTVELPCNLEQSRVSIELRDGMLLVRVMEGDLS